MLHVLALSVFYVAGIYGLIQFTASCTKAWTYWQTVRRKHYKNTTRK